MNNKLSLLFTHSENRKIKFIIERLKLKGNLKFERSQFKSYKVLTILFEKQSEYILILDIVSDCILLFDKYDTIFDIFCSDSNINYYYSCLIGATVSVDYRTEKKKILSILENLYSVTFSTFSYFTMPEIKDNWTNLASLTYRLYCDCNADDEKYDLVSFLLSMDKKENKNLTLCEDYILIANEKYPIPEFYGDKEMDTIIAIVSQRPYSVIIQKPESYSGSFIKAIKTLGKN